MQLEQIAERVASNQSRFRQANEQIERTAQELAPSLGLVPFLCECPDPRCTAIARLSLADYETVRSRGNWFLTVPGHETCVVDGAEVARISERYDGYTMMEKVGEAGELAERLDPRA